MDHDLSHRDPKGFYAALHVPPDATQQQIHRAFRALVRRHHPDVGASAEGDEVLNILDAFAALRNPKSRAEYDSSARASGPELRPATSLQTVPLRSYRRPEPVLRVTPVRWESGPW